MSGITIKQGDTLILKAKYKQSNGDPVNLTGFNIQVNILGDQDKELLKISTTDTLHLDVRKVEILDAINGEFNCIIKDTDIFKVGAYHLDFTYISPDKIAQSSKAIKLAVKGKLM